MTQNNEKVKEIKKEIKYLKHKIWMVKNCHTTIFIDDLNLKAEDYVKKSKKKIKQLEIKLEKLHK